MEDIKEIVWKRYEVYEKEILFENEEVVIFSITFADDFVMILDKKNKIMYAYCEDGHEYITEEISIIHIGWTSIKYNNRRLITDIISKYIDIPRIYFL